MKYNDRIAGVSVVLLTLLMASTSVFARCNGPLRVVVSTTEAHSPSLQLLKQVVGEMQCELVFVEHDARQSRRLRLLESHQVDIVPEASDLPERREYAWISAPYRIERTGIFVSKQNTAKWPPLTLDKIKDLKLRVLVPSGWHGSVFEQWREMMRTTPNYIEFAAAKEALRDMTLNRADVLIASDYTINIELKNTAQLQLSGNWFYQEPVSFLLNKKTFTTALRDDFDRALRSRSALNMPAAAQ